MGTRRRIYLVFGGRSGEHEISLLSARNVLGALNPDRYEVVPIGISRAGRWMQVEDAHRALREGIADDEGPVVALLADPTRPELRAVEAGAAPSPMQLAAAPAENAVWFPVLHGTYGEDGTIQGLLEMAGVPYVGCGVLASSLAMDKAAAKAAFAAAGLELTPWQLVRRSDLEAGAEAVLARLMDALTFPVFVKPANLGSSVGISKATDRASLAAALDKAARFDRRIVVEQGIAGREIEVAVLGNDRAEASLPGEIVPGNDFYDYEDKYFDDDAELRIPAPLTPAQSDEVRALAVRAFESVDGAGMARVDFFLEEGSDRFIINEVNTIPGFTRISMYPKLWEATGLDYDALVDRLVALALARHADRARNRTSV